MSTLLPTPDAPMMKKTCPVGTSNETSWRTVLGPNDLMMFLNWIIERKRRADVVYTRVAMKKPTSDELVRRVEALEGAVEQMFGALKADLEALRLDLVRLKASE